jgi:hypothetical protein
MEGSYDGRISIMKNDVSEIVPRTKGKYLVTSKWVYKIKQAVDGSIDKDKKRFMARGFSQQEGEDYDETFMSLTTSMGWSLHKMDVKTTFLNGVIEEEVYIEQPQGFEVQLISSLMYLAKHFLCCEHVELVPDGT